MIHISLIFFSSLLFSIIGTPIVKVVALRVGIIDQPAKRKVHTTPIPLLGGVAIYLAVFIALSLFSNYAYLTQLFAVFIGASWISLFGLWDDKNGLGVKFKLLAQIGSAVILILSGIMINLPIHPGFNVILTILWVVGITNAMNLLDNMDGLSSGVGAIGAMFFLILSILSGQYLVGGLAAAVLGACLGFLIYNFNPASIFMGDTGSLFLGFMLAVLGMKIQFPTTVEWATWLIPILILGIPIFDTTLVFISRLRRKKNPLTTPGKDHISHRLVKRGFSHREAVLLIYLAGSTLGALAIFLTYSDLTTTFGIGSSVCFAATALLYRFEKIHTQK